MADNPWPSATRVTPGGNVWWQGVYYYIQWWDGAALQTARLLGWWDGDSVEPLTVAGWWDGDSIEALRTS